MAEPALPRRFRPLWARRVIIPMQVLVVVVFAYGAVVVAGGPDPWAPYDRGSIVVVGFLIVAFLQRLAGVRVDADDDGVTVVNILRRRRLEWAQVVAVRLPPADPWLILDLSDGTSLAAMGVQGSDGAYARRQAQELAQLVAVKTRTERDD